MRNCCEKDQAWHQKQTDAFCEISKPVCKQYKIQEQTGQESDFQMSLMKTS